MKNLQSTGLFLKDLLSKVFVAVSDRCNDYKVVFGNIFTILASIISEMHIQIIQLKKAYCFPLFHPRVHIAQLDYSILFL